MIVLCGQVHATTLLQKNFQNLVDEAEGVVEGTIAKVESYYDQQFRIYSYVTLDRLTIHSGSFDEESLVLRMAGGQVGDEVQWIEGSPRFETGDKVILFLRGNGRSLVPIVGWTQGVFRVLTDSRTLEETVRDYQGNRIFKIEGNALVKERRGQSEALLMDPQTGQFIPETGSVAEGLDIPKRQEEGVAVEGNIPSSSAATSNQEKTLSKEGFVNSILRQRNDNPISMPAIASVEIPTVRQQAPPTPSLQSLPNTTSKGVAPQRYPGSPQSLERGK